MSGTRNSAEWAVQLQAINRAFSSREQSLLSELDLARRRIEELIAQDAQSAAGLREAEDLRAQIGKLQAALEEAQSIITGLQDSEKSLKAAHIIAQDSLLEQSEIRAQESESLICRLSLENETTNRRLQALQGELDRELALARENSDRMHDQHRLTLEAVEHSRTDSLRSLDAAHSRALKLLEQELAFWKLRLAETEESSGVQRKEHALEISELRTRHEQRAESDSRRRLELESIWSTQRSVLEAEAAQLRQQIEAHRDSLQLEQSSRNSAEDALRAAILELESLKSRHSQDCEKLLTQAANASAEVKALRSQLDAISDQLSRARAIHEQISASGLGRLLMWIGRPVAAFPSNPVLNTTTSHTAATAAPVPTQPFGPTEATLLHSLLALNDVEFVRASYRTLLKREADASGEQHYVSQLRSGHDKLRLLGSLAFSKEGRSVHTRLPGLKRALLLRQLGRLPLLGPPVAGLLGLFVRPRYPSPELAWQQQSYAMQAQTLAAVGEVLTVIRDLRTRQDSLESSMLVIGERVTRMGQLASGQNQQVLVADHDPGEGGDSALHVALRARSAAWKA